MIKKTLLLLLLPACQVCFGQENHEQEEGPVLPVISMLKKEIEDSRFRLIAAGTKQPASAVFFSPADEIKMLRESRDYHDPEALLRNNMPGDGTQEIAMEHFTNVTANLNGVVIPKLDCYIIRDQYRIRPENELPGDFLYDNTYFLYQNSEGTTLATIIYVKCSIGNITTEHKVVKSGLPALAIDEFTLAPNPARKKINIAFHTTQKDRHSLLITTIDGRNVSTLFDKRQHETGSHTYTYDLDLPAGAYFVTLSAERSAPLSRKLIIQ